MRITVLRCLIDECSHRERAGLVSQHANVPDSISRVLDGNGRINAESNVEVVISETLRELSTTNEEIAVASLILHNPDVQ